MNSRHLENVVDKKLETIEKNPGPRITVARTSQNMFLGDSTIAKIENPLWSIRAIHGGRPADLTAWVREDPRMLRGVTNVVILCGGNQVCNKRREGEQNPPPPPPTAPQRTFEAMMDLVDAIREFSNAKITVIGVPKRLYALPAEIEYMGELNERLQNGAGHYNFIGTGRTMSSDSCYDKEDGVHLTPTGIGRLASLLRKTL